MTRDEAEAALQAWATVQRDELVREAHEAGVSKNRIFTITGIARTTINRILEVPVELTQQQALTSYLAGFTRDWPRDSYAWGGWPDQQVSASWTVEQLAQALLEDAEFRALKLGTWLNTPDGELVAAAVGALTPPPYSADVKLLIDALQLAAQLQQNEARGKIAAVATIGALVGVAAAASRS